jgi:hypothetical protein
MTESYMKHITPQRSKVSFIIIPAKLSQGVISSQIIEMSQHLYGLHKCVFLIVGRSAHGVIKALACEYPEETFLLGIRALLMGSAKVERVYFRSVILLARIYPVLIIAGLCRRIVFDFRALVSEESYFKNKSLLKAWMLQVLERFAYLVAREVRCVSTPLKKGLEKRFGRREVCVIPSCVSRRHIIRKAGYVGTESKIRLVYVGGMSEWQRFELVCSVVSRLSSFRNCRFAVVTADTDKARKICDRATLDNYYVTGGDRQLVFDELDKADFGLIFRNNSVINRTASPIKFVEYIARGVIPITYGSIGDFTDDVSLRKLIVKYKDSIGELLKDISVRLKDNDLLEYMWKMADRYTWEAYGEN